MVMAGRSEGRTRLVRAHHEAVQACLGTSREAWPQTQAATNQIVPSISMTRRGEAGAHLNLGPLWLLGGRAAWHTIDRSQPFASRLDRLQIP